MKNLYILALLLAATNTVSGQCDVTTYTGEGTYYTYTGGGNCSFPRPYNTLYAAALNAPQYGTADLCGACAEVTGPGGTLTVSIEDQCPECAFGDIDLEADAFPFIAEPILGRVPISWKLVPCPVTGPVSFYIKEGSSQYWIAIQVRNHLYPISKFEVLVNGSYVELPRVEYNYFEAATGLGTGPFTFRITDYFGQIITEENIPLIITTEIPGQEQFPVCGVVTGKPEIFKDRPHVFPNPAVSGKTIIINPTDGTINYELVNLLGKVVDQGTVDSDSQHELILKEQGTYIVIVGSGENREVIKVTAY